MRLSRRIEDALLGVVIWAGIGVATLGLARDKFIIPMVEADANKPVILHVTTEPIQGVRMNGGTYSRQFGGVLYTPGEAQEILRQNDQYGVQNVPSLQSSPENQTLEGIANDSSPIEQDASTVQQSAPQNAEPLNTDYPQYQGQVLRGLEREDFGDLISPSHYTKLMLELFSRKGIDVDPLKIKWGESNEARRLQKHLARLGYNVEIDGDYGPQAEIAIERLQKDNGVQPTYGLFGRVGTLTQQDQ